MALSPALRIIDGPLEPDTIAGRSIAILVADGSDAKAVATLAKAITGAGARAVIVAPKVGGAKLSDGTLLKADAQLAGYPSVLADAVAIVLSEEGCAQLLNEAAAVQFVMDAFGHLKAIAHTPEAQALLDKAGVVPDDGVLPVGSGFAAAAAKRYWAREPGVRMLP
jgi:catalase